MTRDEQTGLAAGGVAWIILGVLGSVRIYPPVFAPLAAAGLVMLVVAGVGLARDAATRRRRQPRRTERI